MNRILLLTALTLFLFGQQAESQMRGLPYAPRAHSWRIGIEGGVGVLGSDLTKESEDYHFRPVAGVEIAYVLHRNIAIGLYGGGGHLRSTAGDMESNTGFLSGGALIELRLPLLRGSVFPVLQLRGGGLIIDPELRIGAADYDFSSSNHLSFSLAAGIEVVSWRRLGIRALFGVTYTSTDSWDLLVRGEDKDGFSFAILSMHYYIGRRR
jgi:hypothetical protein